MPAGTHTWGFDLDGGDSAGPAAFPSTMTMSQITVAAAWFHAEQAESGRAWAFYVEPADEGTSNVWVGVADLTLPAGTWTEFALPGLTYSWTKYDTSSGWTVTGTAAAGGVPAFVAAHGGSGYGGYAATMGCNGGKFNFDKFSIGSSGNVTVYDFEGLSTTTTMVSKATTIVAGRRVSIAGDLEPTFNDATVQLEAKTYASSEWVPVGTVGSGSTGEPFSMAVKPLKQTSYRWTFPGAACCSSSTSEPVVIKVKTALTATRSASAVRPGQGFAINGRSTPAKPGFTATLWRKTASGPVKLKSTTIKADGRYGFTVRPTKVGKWTMYVTVPAGTGNLAGTSPTTTVTVRR